MENEIKQVNWHSGEPSCEWDYPVSEDHTSTSSMAILDEYGEVVAFAVTAFAGFHDAKKEKELDARVRLISAAPTMYGYIEQCASDGCEEAKKIMEAINAGC